MFANSNRCSRTFTCSAHQLFRTARAHITGRENAFCARLKIHARHNKALSINFGDIAEWFAVWLQTDKDKNTRYMQFLYLARFVVLDNNCIQVVLLSFELDNIRIEAYLHLRRVQRLVSS